MSERDQLMRAICANPEEDTPRLVFADWLDEHDTEPSVRAWARYIRTAVKAAAVPCCEASANQSPRHETVYRCRCERCRLLRSVDTDRQRHHDKWHLGVWDIIERRGAKTTRPWNYAVDFVRGFLGRPSMSADMLVACAGELFAAAPVTDVNVLYCVPWEFRGEWQWHRGKNKEDWRGSRLPPRLFDRVPGRQVVGQVSPVAKVFASKAEAERSLSVGGLAFGRAERDRLWAGISHPTR